MTQTFDETKTEDCGCAETTTRDVSGKVVKQDFNHCIAHAIEWAGKFLVQAGRRLIAEAQKPVPVATMAAIYRGEDGKRIWVDNPYPYPAAHNVGDVLLHEDKGYRVTQLKEAGKMFIFTVEECDPCDATVVVDAVVDHLKRHGLKEATTDETDN